MQQFVDSVRDSINEGNWNAALFISLCLPDICGKITWPDLINQSQRRYIRWFDENLAQNYTLEIGGQTRVLLSGTDCYALRCALTHFGSDDITSQRAREIIERFTFTLFGNHIGLYHNNFYLDGNQIMMPPTTLELNVQRFCEEICVAVEMWLVEASRDDRMRQEISSTLRIYTIVPSDLFRNRV